MWLLVSMMLAIDATSGIPQLSKELQQQLSEVIDGGDHREEVFLAFVEHVGGWPADGEIGDAAVRLQPDLDAMVADPASYRGDLCRVSGRVEQVTNLPPPFERAAEWFVRDAQGRPCIVYIVRSPGEQNFAAGQHITVHARFYKRMDFTARDGLQRSYAAFVGAHPRPLQPVSNVSTAASGAATPIWAIAVPVGALLLVFIGMRWLLLRTKKRVTFAPKARAGHIEVDDRSDLPDDPVAALAELRRRSQI